MHTINSLNRYLDDHPNDNTARLALGDALREADSPLADGISALGLLGKWPYRLAGHTGWSFAVNKNATTILTLHDVSESIVNIKHPFNVFKAADCWVLPECWGKLVRTRLNELDYELYWGPIFRTRREAEEHAAEKFLLLTSEEQEELLALTVG